MKLEYWGCDQTEKINTDEPINENIINSPKDSNIINFFGEINNVTMSNFCKELDEKTATLLIYKHRYNIDDIRIRLHINSPGGYVRCGYGIMDKILQNIIPVDTYIIGAAASAATYLSIVGKKRYIYENSYILIHQISGFSFGKFEELKDDIKNIEDLSERMKNIYLKYTKIPKDILEDLLKHDLYISSNKALEYGFVDEIIK